MGSLKKKTEGGLFWSMVESVLFQGSSFIIGIVLARLLSPKEFGLIGMITIFFAISNAFIGSGFNQALIRKEKCTQEDFSTVFYFNFLASLLFFTLLYFSANPISIFFEEPQLLWIIRVLGLDLIIRSISIIQGAIIVKNVDFKLFAKISVFSNFTSGALGIYMAYTGFGVWSLVAKTLSYGLVNTILLWGFNNWRPSLVFSKSSFKELFGFGSKLMVSSLINTIYSNIYYVLIGKFYSVQQLGYFTRAKNFSDLPSLKMTQIISRVTYPVLSQLQNDEEKLKSAYKVMIKNIMFVSFIVMIAIAATSETLIILLIGEKWRQSIPYLQLLSIASMIYPLQSINLNILKVQGRSDLYLKLEIVKKIYSIPIIVIGVFTSMYVLIIGICLIAFIDYFLNSFYSGRLINYSVKEQIIDLLPSLFIAIIMGAAVYIIGELINIEGFLKLTIQGVIGILVIVVISEKIKLKEYFYIKDILVNKLKLFRKKF